MTMETDYVNIKPVFKQIQRSMLWFLLIPKVRPFITTLVCICRCDGWPRIMWVTGCEMRGKARPHQARPGQDKLDHTINLQPIHQQTRDTTHRQGTNQSRTNGPHEPYIIRKRSMTVKIHVKTIKSDWLFESNLKIRLIWDLELRFLAFREQIWCSIEDW